MIPETFKTLAELLKWAKENYENIKGVDKSRELITTEINSLQEKIANCK